jgi:hypothetical protein
LIRRERAPDRAPKPARAWENAGSRNQDRTIGMIQNAAGKIAHNVMPEHAARLRGAGHDQVGIAFAHFSENLVNHDSVANMHFRRHAKFFEILFLGAEIDSKF